MTYQEKLKDPRWQKRRLEILERDKFTCQECQSTKKELHVHHRRYRKKMMPWDHKDHDLITYCTDCHKLMTKLRRELDDLLGTMNIEEIGTLGLFLDHTLQSLGGRWCGWLHWTHYFAGWSPKSNEVLEAERSLAIAVADQSMEIHERIRKSINQVAKPENQPCQTESSGKV